MFKKQKKKEKTEKKKKPQHTEESLEKRVERLIHLHKDVRTCIFCIDSRRWKEMP